MCTSFLQSTTVSKQNEETMQLEACFISKRLQSAILFMKSTIVSARSIELA